MQLIYPIDELGVGLDELGSYPLRLFEMARLGDEPGPLALDKPSTGFGRALPGVFSVLQGVSTDPETFVAAVSGKESTVRTLDAAEDLFVDSASNLEILVAGSNGCVHPPSCAGPEVGEVLLQDGLLFSYSNQLIGDVRRDALDEFSVLGTKLAEALRG